MFNTKEEFILALMEGRKFEYGTSSIYYNKTVVGNPFRLEKDPLNGFFDKYGKVTEVFINWYDDPINIGKLCWFWNEPTDEVILDKLRGYAKDYEHPYEAKLSDDTFKNAKLLTTEELSVLGGIEQIKNT